MAVTVASQSPDQLGTGPSLCAHKLAVADPRGSSRVKLSKGDLDVGYFHGRAGNPRLELFVQDTSVFYIEIFLL